MYVVGCEIFSRIRLFSPRTFWKFWGIIALSQFILSCSIETKISDIASSLSQPIQVELQSPTTAITNLTSIPVTLLFSEEIADIQAAHLQVSGATLSAITGSGKSFSFTLTPLVAEHQVGNVEVYFPNQIVQLAASEQQKTTNSSVLNFVIDRQYPTVNLSSVISGVTNATNIPVSVNFSEPVEGLTASDFVVSGGGASAITLTGSGSQYILNVVPMLSANITVDLPAQTVRDRAGNGNYAASAPFTVIYDIDIPIPVLSSNVSSPTNAAMIEVMIDFSGVSVTGLELSDFQVSQGHLQNLSGSGSSYTVQLVPSITDGTVSIQLPAGRVENSLGSANLASTVLSWVIDQTPPSVILSGPVPALGHSGSSFQWTAQYTGASSIQLAEENVLLSGSGSSGCAVTVEGSGLLTRTIEVSECATEGSLSIQLQAGTAVDAAGNAVSISAVSSSATIDNTLPSLTVTGPTPAVGNTSTSFEWTLTYSDYSTIQLNASHITAVRSAGVTGCAVTVSTAAPNIRKVQLQNCQGDGNVSIQIAAETATNALGLKALANTSASSAEVDNTPPVITIGSVNPSIGNSSSQFEWEVQYSGASLVQLTSALVTLSGTAVNGDCVTSIVDTANALEKKIRVTGCSLNGTLGVSLAAASARDLAGNLALAATSASQATVDNNSFSGLLATTVSSPTYLAVIPVTVIFNDEPLSFTSGNLSVQNGSIENFTGSGLSYSFDLRATADGDMSVQILSGVLQNSVGNPNEVSNVLTVHVDRIAPTLTLSGPTPTIGNRNTDFIWSVSYSEADIITMQAEDVIVSGTAASSCSEPVVAITGEFTRSVTISGCQAATGGVQIQIAAESARDHAGNKAAISSLSSAASVDNEPPAMILVGPLAEEDAVLVGNSTSKFLWEVTYTGHHQITLATGDVSVVSTGTVSGCVKTVTSSGTNSRYISLTNCSGDGSVTVHLAAGTAVDGVGNLATALTVSDSATVDNTKPTLAISGPDVAAGNVDETFTWTLDYTGHQAITLAAADITPVTTGTVSGCVVSIVNVSASRREVELTSCSGDGTVKIQIAAASARDAAGNLAEANSVSVAAVIDNTGPSLTIAGSGPLLGNTATVFQWTLNYVEATNIGSPVISLTGTATAGCSSEISGSGTEQRLVSVTGCSGNGTLGISVAVGSAQDTYGNTSLAATSSYVNVDNTAPVLTISSSTPSMGNATATFTWNLSYAGADEVNLTAADISLVGTSTGCSAPVLSADELNYKVTTTGCTGNGNLRIQVEAGTAQDAAGNLTALVLGPNAVVDNIAPNITFYGGSTFYLHGERTAVWIAGYSSSNTVSHVSETTLLLETTGTASCVNMSRQAFPGTLSLSVDTCSGDGEIRWRALEGAIIDLAGNKSAEVLSYPAYADSTPPVVTIETPLANEQIIDFANTQFSGACSDEGMYIVATPAAKASIVCTGGRWTAEVDYSSTTSEELTLTLNAKDLAQHTVETSITLLRATYKVKSIYASRDAFVAVRADGSVVSWGGTAGLPPAVIRERDGNVKKIVSNEGAFAALQATGTVVTWGDSLKGGDISAVTGVSSGFMTDIFAGTDILLAETTVGKIAAWGHPDRGSLPDLSGTAFAEVLPGYRAVAGRTSDGGVVAWGDPNFGGSTAEVSAQLTRVKSLAATKTGAFAALKLNGTVVAWGNIGTSGNRAPASVTAAGSDVKAVVGNDAAFAALKANGSVVAWGDALKGGDTSSATSSLSFGVKSLIAGKESFAAIKADGKVVVWGNLIGSGVPSDLSMASGMDGAVSIVVNSAAFAALTAKGQVLAWGDPLAGGSLGTKASLVDSGVKQIFKTDRAFAALKADGSVVSWGDENAGGDSSTVAAQLTSKVIELSATASAFAALKSDGKVVTWGEASSGGDSSAVAHKLAGVLNAVKKIEGAGGGFYALKSDGSITSWGDLPIEFISGDISSGVSDVLAAGDSGDGIAMKDDGTLVGWNPWFNANGERIPASVTSAGANIKKVFNDSYMPYLAALRTDGSVVTWGHYGHGEYRGAPASVTAPNSQVIDIVTNGSARVALKVDGTVRSWSFIEDGGLDYAGGGNDFGGSAPSSVTMEGSNVIKVVASWSAFAALKADGSVVCWGWSNYGGAGCTSLQAPQSRVIDIEAGTNGFVAMLANGTVKSWGTYSTVPADYEVEGHVRKIVGYEGGFMGQSYDGSVTFWGGVNGNCNMFCPKSKDIKVVKMYGTSVEAYGISNSGYLNVAVSGHDGVLTTPSKLASGFQELVSTGNSYASLHGHGRFYTWGYVSTTAENTISNAVSIKASWSAFTVLRGDGSVYAWGDEYAGGILLDDLKD